MFDLGQSKGVNDSSYRKGLVLGFTLAEIMLLVVFCLLLISGAVIKKIEIEAAKITEIAKRTQIEMEATKRAQTDMEAANTARADPSFLYLKVPKDKIVFEDSVPKPDSTGTIVSLWPVLEDRNKTDLVARLNADNQLDTTTLEDKLKLVGKMSIEELTGLIAKNAPTKPIENGIPASTLAKLNELRAQANDWNQVDQLLSSSALSGHRWPPIISLEETKGYAFQSGRSEITNTFSAKLSNEAVPKIVKLLNDYGADIVEIVGHTDSVPVHEHAYSNLDEQLGPYIEGISSSSDINVADNAGLGLARAAAVAQILLSDRRLANVHVVALSAGQLLKPDGGLDLETSKIGDEKRRRLEVRIRCSTDSCEKRP